MILDRLCEASRYEGLHSRFHEAFEFLKTANDKPCGRYELGGGMYVNIMDARTHAAGDGLFEAHRRYIDIQYLFAGHSACVWAPTDSLEVKTPFDEEKDCEFFTGEGNPVSVRAGDFYILWPSDAHEPHRQDGEPDAYRVAVVKVPV